MIAVGAAILSIVFARIGPVREGEKRMALDRHYKAISFKKLAEHIVEKYPGSKAVLITDVYGSNEWDQERKRQILDPFISILEKGSIEIVHKGSLNIETLSSAIDQSSPDQPGDGTFDTPETGWDLQELEIFKITNKKKRKKIVVSYESFDSEQLTLVKDMIKTEWIHSLLLDKNSGLLTVEKKSEVPDDEQKAFDSRYVIVTSENVDQLSDDL